MKRLEWLLNMNNEFVKGYKKGKTRGLYKALSAEGRVLMNKEVESLKEVCQQKDHAEI